MNSTLDLGDPAGTPEQIADLWRRYEARGMSFAQAEQFLRLCGTRLPEVRAALQSKPRATGP